jgi:hypothetical protein
VSRAPDSVRRPGPASLLSHFLALLIDRRQGRCHFAHGFTTVQEIAFGDRNVGKGLDKGSLLFQ